MKTKDAFAFRDFDAFHILQRKFFLHRLKVLLASTDADIIDLYNVENVAHLGVASMEQRLVELRRLKSIVETYVKYLNRHAGRIFRLQNYYINKFMQTVDDVVKKKYERAEILSDCYGVAIDLVCNIIRKLSTLEKENEKMIQRQYREEFAANLKKARLARKMTQKELASLLDIATPSLSQYENAIIEPTIKNLVRLANALNISTDELLGRTC